MSNESSILTAEQVTMTMSFYGDMAPLFEALAQAQAEIDPAVKRANNPFFKSKYADISVVLDTIKPAMNKHGLAIMQFPNDCAGSQVELTTVISHRSGSAMVSIARCPQGKGGGPQGAGSGITYLRRYCAQAALGLSAEDDDGNGAQDAHKKAKKPAQSDYFKDNRKRLMVEWTKAGWDYETVAYLCEVRKGKRPSGMSEKEIKGLNRFLETATDDEKADYAKEARGAE